MDPPYGDKKEDKYYGVDDYMIYMMDRIKALTQFHFNYNLIIHVDQKYSHYLKVDVDRLLGKKWFKNEIVWCYSGPSVSKKQLPRKHDSLLWWQVGQGVYNPEYVPYKSLADSQGWGEMDRDKMLERGKMLEDWWTDISALQRNESEKVGYATQKPAALLNRIVRMFSNRTVVDPFSGSGTTMRACHYLQREFVGYDIADVSQYYPFCTIE